MTCGSRAGKNVKEDFIKRKLVIDEHKLQKAAIFIDKVVELFDSIYGNQKKIGNAWFRILAKLYNVDVFSYDRLYKAVNNKSSSTALDLKDITSQHIELVSRYLLELYNHNLSTKRIRAKSWQDLKSID